ncbi:MAG: hypothetical protein IK079_06350 [Desulfovibrio sp.]|nr:hypothetical protein [Desulfovibrio sp.]
MRTILFCLAFLLLPAQAWSETATFGDDEVQYQVEIPENWEESVQQHGIQLVSQDKNSALTVSLYKKDDLSLQSIYQVLPSRLDMTEVQKQKKKNNNLEIVGNIKGVRVQILFKDEDDYYLVIVSAGSQKEVIADCIASVKKNTNNS